MDYDYTRVFAHAYRQSLVFFAERLREFGVSSGQFPHLMCACDHPGSTQEEIAERTRTDESTVARMMRQLLDAGLRMRRDNPGAKRSFLIFPTPKAMAMYPVILGAARKRENGVWELPRSTVISRAHFLRTQSGESQIQGTNSIFRRRSGGGTRRCPVI